MVTLDLAIKFCQLAEVSLCGAERGAEGIMCVPQGPDFLQRVAPYGVSQIFLSVLKPAVEG